jgi:hypothetical protein
MDAVNRVAFPTLSRIRPSRTLGGDASGYPKRPRWVVRGRDIYFTLVDGRVVLANSAPLSIDRVIDFNAMHDPNTLLGWCRGVLPVDEQRLWVGFSRVRKTLFQDNVLGVKRVFKESMIERPTHIFLYDIGQKRCPQEFDLEPHGVNTIYSIFPANY